MIYILIVCVFLLLIGIVILYFENKQLKNHIVYVRKKLDLIAENDEKSLVLIPSDEKEVQKLANSINRLLDNYYKCKQNNKIIKDNMQQMITNISHDLKTPVTVLKGYMELLILRQDEWQISPEVRKILQKVDRKTEHLTKAINEIFLLAKVKSHEADVEEKEENLTQLCEEIIMDYYDLLEEKRIDTDIKIPEYPVKLKTNAKIVSRILKNLIDNALKYGMDGRYLCLELLDQDGQALINVIDHGQGISKENQKKVFERNYTEDNYDKGSGLGLAISKELAEEINGSLAVESAQNKETKFTLMINKS